MAAQLKLRRRLIEVRRSVVELRPPPLIFPDRFPRCRWKWDRELFPTVAAVAFDAKTATWTTVNGVSPLTISNLTVGVGTNRALSVMVMCSITAGALPPGLTAIWDSGGTNQPSTQVAGTVIADSGPPCGAAMYGLIAPTSGNKSLVLAWTGGGSFEVHACAISFTGVDQTSVAVAFPHGAHNNANGASPATVTITSAAGNMVVACHAQNFSPYGVVSGTTLAKDDVTGPNLGVVSNYANGAASVAMTAAFTGTGPWSSIGCDVLAAGGAASPTPYNPWPLWGPVLAQ